MNVLSKLTFVDLAGNERVGKSSSTGNRLEEAKSINSSLSSLSNVISSLRQEKSTYHFRKSKLTKILQVILFCSEKKDFIGWRVLYWNVCNDKKIFNLLV